MILTKKDGPARREGNSCACVWVQGAPGCVRYKHQQKEKGGGFAPFRRDSFILFFVKREEETDQSCSAKSENDRSQKADSAVEI